MSPIDKVKGCIARIMGEMGDADAVEIVVICNHLLKGKGPLRLSTMQIVDRIEQHTVHDSPAILDAALEVIKMRSVRSLNTMTE